MSETLVGTSWLEKSAEGRNIPCLQRDLRYSTFCSYRMFKIESLSNYDATFYATIQRWRNTKEFQAQYNLISLLWHPDCKFCIPSEFVHQGFAKQSRIFSIRQRDSEELMSGDVSETVPLFSSDAIVDCISIINCLWAGEHKHRAWLGLSLLTQLSGNRSMELFLW
jgi:hypothetical protein